MWRRRIKSPDATSAAKQLLLLIAVAFFASVSFSKRNADLNYLLGLTDDPTPHWTAQKPRENSASTELAEIKTRLAQIELALKDAVIKIAAPEN